MGDECLNQEMFLSVTEARVVIEEWRCFYNRIHPHSRLGFQSPEDYGAPGIALRWGYASAMINPEAIT